MKVSDLPVTPEQISEYMPVVGYRLLILPDHVETKSTGGIIQVVDYDGALDMEKAHISSGVVVAIGPMAWRGIKGYDYEKGGPWCKVGDHVKYSKYSGKFLNDPLIRDEEEKSGMLKYALVNDEDIQCVLEDDKIENLKKELYNG